MRAGEARELAYKQGRDAVSGDVLELIDAAIVKAAREGRFSLNLNFSVKHLAVKSDAELQLIRQIYEGRGYRWRVEGSYRTSGIQYWLEWKE